MKKYCGGCGELAVTECPHCQIPSCSNCIPICEHDARKPKDTAAEFVKWLETPEGKAAAAKAKECGDETRKLFKPRGFTAEELNQRYGTSEGSQS